MENIQIIFDFCTQIMRININLYGYSVSLFSVIVFVFLAAMIIKLLRHFS